MAELQSLSQGKLEDLLGSRGEGDVPTGSLGSLADDLHDLGTDRLEIDAHRLEAPGRHALALVDQAQQDVLGADVVVVEEARLLLSEDDDPAGPVGESLEHVWRL